MGASAPEPLGSVWWIGGVWRAFFWVIETEPSPNPLGFSGLAFGLPFFGLPPFLPLPLAASMRALALSISPSMRSCTQTPSTREKNSESIVSTAARSSFVLALASRCACSAGIPPSVA